MLCIILVVKEMFNLQGLYHFSIFFMHVQDNIVWKSTLAWHTSPYTHSPKLCVGNVSVGVFSPPRFRFQKCIFQIALKFRVYSPPLSVFFLCPDNFISIPMLSHVFSIFSPFLLKCGFPHTFYFHCKTNLQKKASSLESEHFPLLWGLPPKSAQKGQICVVF